MKSTAINLSLQNHQANQIAVALFILIASALYLSGVAAVPFHPDESTMLYMSTDFDLYFSEPLSMAWKPDQVVDQRMQYRLLDAPLTRYLLGFSRRLAGIPPLPTDWDWSKSWQENEQNNALPSQALLFNGRMIVSLFFALCLVLIYSIGIEISGLRTAWLAMCLFALNALILIHTRRAMAESALVFTMLLSLWVILRTKQRPWLVAIPLALAFCAKQSSAPLVLVGLIGVIANAFQKKPSLSQFLRNLLVFTALFLLIYTLLNPFTWFTPIQSNLAALQARQALLNEQVAAIQSVSPEHILTSLPSRLVGIIGNLFFTPPAVADVANYIDNTKEMAAQYLSNPLHLIFRDWFFGLIYLLLSLVGFVWMGFALRKKQEKRASFLLILIAASAQFIFQIIAIPLTFQRYVIPLVPFSILFIAYCLDQILIGIVALLKKSVLPSQPTGQD